MSQEAKPAEAGGGPGPKRSARWPWICLVLMVVVVGAEVGGLLLRDPLEGRRTILAHAPQAAPAPGTTSSAPSAQNRFGPDVHEVVVAPPATEAPAPAEAPSSSPPPPETEEAVRAPPPPKTRTPPPEGSDVLVVDTFLSQKYLRATESKLDVLGVPHFRQELTRKGPGRRLEVVVPDAKTRQEALRVLQARKYVYRETPGGFELYFYYEKEAGNAAAELSRHGIASSVSRVEGKRPFWRVLAGPFSPEQAGQVRQRLAAQGIHTVLRKMP